MMRTLLLCSLLLGLGCASTRGVSLGSVADDRKNESDAGGGVDPDAGPTYVDDDDHHDDDEPWHRPEYEDDGDELEDAGDELEDAGSEIDGT